MLQLQLLFLAAQVLPALAKASVLTTLASSQTATAAGGWLRSRSETPRAPSPVTRCLGSGFDGKGLRGGGGRAVWRGRAALPPEPLTAASSEAPFAPRVESLGFHRGNDSQQLEGKQSSWLSAVSVRERREFQISTALAVLLEILCLQMCWGSAISICRLAIFFWF